MSPVHWPLSRGRLKSQQAFGHAESLCPGRAEERAGLKARPCLTHTKQVSPSSAQCQFMPQGRWQWHSKRKIRVHERTRAGFLGEVAPELGLKDECDQNKQMEVEGLPGKEHQEQKLGNGSEPGGVC